MSQRHGLEIGAIVAISIAAVGLVSGIEGSDRPVDAYVKAPPATRTTSVVARSYRDLRVHPTGPNGLLANAWWQAIAAPADLFLAMPQREADRTTALAHRAERRAFDGAPPMIPHAVDQLGTPACLTCHDRDVKLAGLTAPRMSHQRYDSCLQCHVVARDPRPGATTPPAVTTTFVAAPVPHGGERAWPGAPPTIPHSILMRDRCTSCHGTRGALGLRSPHPWQQSCTQCHAPSAVLDQRAPATFGRTP